MSAVETGRVFCAGMRIVSRVVVSGTTMSDRRAYDSWNVNGRYVYETTTVSFTPICTGRSRCCRLSRTCWCEAARCPARCAVMRLRVLPEQVAHQGRIQPDAPQPIVDRVVLVAEKQTGIAQEDRVGSFDDELVRELDGTVCKGGGEIDAHAPGDAGRLRGNL